MNEPLITEITADLENFEGTAMTKLCRRTEMLERARDVLTTQRQEIIEECVEAVSNMRIEDNHRISWNYVIGQVEQALRALVHRGKK